MNVTKIIVTRCQIFHLKRTKFNFQLWLGSGEAHSAPQTSKLELEKGKGKGKCRGEEWKGK